MNLRAAEDPVLYLSDPPGIDRGVRRRMLDAVAKLNEEHHAEFGDPEIAARIAQYEMAYRMQASVPELVDTSGEPQSTFDLYGEDARTPGTYAANCLLARRLAERDVRFIQLYQPGLGPARRPCRANIRLQCGDVDRASAALVTDLEQRGLLEDTLVVWGGEFGRTVYCQGALAEDDYGPRPSRPLLHDVDGPAPASKPGTTWGETDDHCYNIVSGGVHIHDLNATVLHQLGIDHERLTYRYSGRDFRLTDVHGRVVEEILA